METRDLKPILEALIFASEEAISSNSLTLVLGEAGVEKSQVEAALQELAQDYNDNAEKGLLLREVGGAYQFVTKPVAASWIQKLNVAKPKSLTQPSLETLAIIAYRQPLVRAEVEAIRGVDSGGVLKTLLERGLIKILGRRDEVGQPLIYGTTPAFLELFHLQNLEELPSLKEIEQMIEDQNTKGESAETEGSTTSEAQWEVEGVSESSSLDFLGEVGDEGEALADLENKMKELKTLEKELFPKEEGAEESPAPVSETLPEPEV